MAANQADVAKVLKTPGGNLHLETVDADLKVTENGVLIEDRERKEKTLVRKIDRRMMPLMMLLYVLNYIDRNNIATARLGSFEKDIGLRGTQYNTVISIFFVGYILTQIPTNMILNKVRPSLFLPAVMICWGSVSACTGAVQNYSGMIVLRFMLGFVEAPFFPGALFLFSCWYTKKELAKRISILFAAGQMAGAFSGFLGSAIMGGMNGVAGLADWRWLFIIEGVMTIPVAFLTYFVVPDYPTNTKWLSDEERVLAVLRIAEEANEEDDREEVSAFQGLKLAFTDISLYLIWMMQLGLNTAAAFTNFFPTIVQTLGYPQRETLLLSSPPYVFAAILGISNSWHSDAKRERWLHILWPQVFACVGFIISATTLNVAARYTATFMMMSIYGSFGAILSWVSTSLPRPSAKRAVAYAFVNAMSNLASIYASYFYPATQGPQYWQANIANVAFSGMCIAMATTLRFYLSWRNKKLDEASAEDMAAEGTANGTKTQALAARWQFFKNLAKGIATNHFITERTMASLSTLAGEILSTIVSYLDPWTPGFSHGEDNNRIYDADFNSLDDLRNLRLTCRALHIVATRQLFRAVRLRPSDESAEKWGNIADSPTLRAHAREAIVDSAMSEDVDPEEPWEPPESWAAALGRLGDFPRVEAVALHFSSQCAAEAGDFWDKEVAETESERSDVLDMVFCALACVNDLPDHGIRALSVKNLQNIVHEGADGEDFKSVVSRLKELHVSICTESDSAAPEHTITKSAVKSFWAPGGFVDKWLKPAAQSLTSLTLYCDAYFGLLPEFDTCGISFPNLRALSLGNFNLAYDWQVDWIVSHKGLRTLWLDDCPIAHYFEVTYYGLEEFRTGELTKLPRAGSSEEVYVSSLRWSDVLDKIREGLPELKDFRLAHGAWDVDQAFEQRHDLGLDLLEKRYMAFNGGIGPSQWVECREGYNIKPDGSYEQYLCYQGAFDEEVLPPNVADPAVEEADKKAFARLLAGLSLES
ncbi:hypothetical protein PpBr36_04814 [Pyricularia pennisetigena]|uniref:hypothetical protein n=1 Tax=Pyricularia pennisetigena TaxID=1578925 RepID=UPI001151815C|nr:hypothetical protein PpBr36_04814 [Pyricularia pennisetigena]TLS27653.1 hypothetical protein PpBr36_04814 [Pyricularia pennisetigena]